MYASFILLSCYSIPARHIIILLLLLMYDIDGARTSSGPAARAKWEIEYRIFFSRRGFVCFYFYQVKAAAAAY